MLQRLSGDGQVLLDREAIIGKFNSRVLQDDVGSTDPSAENEGFARVQ